MAQLAQGQRLTLPITATQGYYFSTSGAAIVRVTPSNGGAFVVTIGNDETDVGWFGFDASLELIAQSGVLTYNTTPSALTAVQLGDQRDSDAVDVALSVNEASAAVNALSSASFPIPPTTSSLISSSGANVAADNITIQQMIMVPADVVAVRIAYAHLGGAGGVTAAKMLVAATDNIGDLSQSQTTAGRQFSVPVKNGTEHNTLSTDGWQVVTFDGSATFDVADAGAQSYTYKWSDIIPVNGQPLRVGDAERFAGFNALLVRFFCGTGRYTKGGISGFNQADWVSFAGQRLVLGASRAGDNIATLANMNTTTTLSYGQSDSLPLVIEAFTSSGARSVFVAGDSRFGSSSQTSTQTYRNTQLYLQQALSVLGNKAGVVALSQGGLNTDAVYRRALNYINSTSPNGTLVYLTYSINDGAPTDAIIAAAKAKLLIVLDAAAKKRVKVIVVTAFPAGAGFTAPQAALLDGLVSFVGSLGVTVFNPLSVYGVAPLYGWQAGFNFDSDHMTNAGYQDMAQRIAALV